MKVGERGQITIAQKFREASLAAVRRAYIEGPMVICEPVHALKRASRLLSRDRGFYRACFRGLRILDPARE